MKKIVLIITIIVTNFCFAQHNDLTIGLILPEPNQKITESQITKLESKLSNVINRSGVVSYGYNNDFVIHPVINVDDVSIVQGGLEKITVAVIDLTLSIKQISSNKSFNIVSKKIKGSGKTEELAVTNAFSLIKVDDKDLLAFITKGKENIFKYYNENCKNILSKAKGLSAKHDFEQALSLAQSIPETGNSCYLEAQKNALTYYQGYQSKLCKENIVKAKAEIAIKNYENALSYLNMIDTNSSCYAEVEKLIGQISGKVEKDENKVIDLEKRRIDAIKEIAKAYYFNAAHSAEYD